MNFGDRERVIMPNDGGASSRQRSRPRADDGLHGQNPYAAAVSIDTLDPFDEVIRLSDLKPRAPQARPAPPTLPEAAAVAQAADPQVDAAKIRAEARQWGKEHVAEADSVATQRILEAEFQARRIMEEARAGARQAHATALVAEPEVIAIAAEAAAPVESEPEPTRRRSLPNPR